VRDDSRLNANVERAFEGAKETGACHRLRLALEPYPETFESYPETLESYPETLEPAPVHPTTKDCRAIFLICIRPTGLLLTPICTLSLQGSRPKEETVFDKFLCHHIFTQF
jgi:hypothetical protein